MTHMLFENANDYIKNKLCHSIHTSERRSFRGCRRRWCWIFRDFYYPTVTPRPLEFGVAYHKAMEVYYNPETWHDRATAAALALVAFRDKCAEQKAAYLEYFPDMGEEAEIEYNDRLELGLGMIKNYTKRLSPVLDKNLTPYKVEVSFEVFIKDPAGNLVWCKCDICWDRFFKSNFGGAAFNAWQEYLTSHDTLLTLSQRVESYRRNEWMGLPVTYGGRIDAVIVDNYGRFWVFDWKTAASLTAMGEDDYLWWDDQITSYCWALWTLGVDIAGFIYAEIKKSYPLEPEPLKNTYQGRRYSTNKQQVYDYDIYLTTIQENDQEAYEAGFYDKFLEHLKSPDNAFGRRHEIHRTDKELEIAGYNIYLEALEMTDSDLRIYPAPGRFACRTCAFAGPCLSKNRGEDFQYELDSSYDKRRYHYWETKEPSTEGKGGE
jgi:hypothetical protein